MLNPHSTIQQSKIGSSLSEPIARVSPVSASLSVAAHHVANVLTQTLQAQIQEFWGHPVTLRFIAVQQSQPYFTRLDTFFTSAVELNQTQNLQVRLSDDGCNNLLTGVMGINTATTAEPFSLNSLSGFEGKLLSKFTADLLKTVHKSYPLPKRNRLNNTSIHLLWLIEPHGLKHISKQSGEALSYGKLLISLPLSCLVEKATEDLPEAPKALQQQRENTFLSDVGLVSHIKLGSTRAYLSDLKQLEDGDLVILENSQTNTLFLWNHLKKDHTRFSVKLNEPEREFDMTDLPDTNMTDEDTLTMSDDKTMWDDLMIEVTAEFDPVRVPLKQLKQMTDGLIVEVGDLVDNRISLNVEGKTLASGTLVIVGDKFGVRIQNVDDDEAPIKAQPKKITTKATPEKGMDKGDLANTDEPAKPAAKKAAKSAAKKPAASTAKAAAKPTPKDTAKQVEAPPAANDDMDDLFSDLDEDDW